MSTVKRGSLLPFLQEESFHFDPQRGYLHTLIYKGASAVAMLNYQQDVVRGGIACRLVFHQGDTASLEIEDSTQQYLIDTWQIVGNEESRDGLSHPGLALALTAAAVDVETVIAEMRQHLENQDLPVPLFAVGGAFSGAPAAVQNFYRLQQRGSTEYRHAQYVLRHTTNAPNRWNSNISDFGVDHIYTQAQLLSEVQNSGLWILPLPGRLVWKIGHIPAPTAMANYQWGWLKGGSSETTAANNRVEITTEYVLEQWSTDYYPLF